MGKTKWVETCSRVHGQNTVWDVYIVTGACADIDARPKPTVSVPVMPAHFSMTVL